LSQLFPCPACQRHVESTETACPFCQVALVPRTPCVGRCSSSPTPARLAGAALVAAGAALMGAACQSQSVLAPYGLAPHFDASPQSNHDAGEPTDGRPDAGDSNKD
jgi:hypothetical protein